MAPRGDASLSPPGAQGSSAHRLKETLQQIPINENSNPASGQQNNGVAFRSLVPGDVVLCSYNAPVTLHEFPGAAHGGLRAAGSILRGFCGCRTAAPQQAPGRDLPASPMPGACPGLWTPHSNLCPCPHVASVSLVHVPLPFLSLGHQTWDQGLSTPLGACPDWATPAKGLSPSEALFMDLGPQHVCLGGTRFNPKHTLTR